MPLSNALNLGWYVERTLGHLYVLQFDVAPPAAPVVPVLYNERLDVFREYKQGQHTSLEQILVMDLIAEIATGLPVGIRATINQLLLAALRIGPAVTI